jgi:type IV pilus assembly protein PilC
MSTYTYSAVDAQGRKTTGAMQAADQNAALRRIKEMGFFPLKVTEQPAAAAPLARLRRHAARLSLKSRAATAPPSRNCRVKSRRLCAFTRQVATLLEAGLPLLRSLRLLAEQESDRRFKRVIADLASSIEGGNSFSEALAQYPKIFSRLYLNLVKAGEISGTLEATLKRLADFMEKSARIKGRVIAGLFYPAAVMTVALGVVALMLIYIVPRFEEVFRDLTGGRPLPDFTRFVLGISNAVRYNFLAFAAAMAGLYGCFRLVIGAHAGRRLWDSFKLRMPVLGTLFRKLAIARFTRTLGTLIASGVPILQALNIIKEATGNVVVGALVGRVHENVKQGESIVGPLRESRIFPVTVVGMIDVGEQTGDLPNMLNRIADNYEEEVDNSVTALTSLLEPLLIVFLGIVVGAIVVAMFLPIIDIGNPGPNGEPGI